MHHAPKYNIILTGFMATGKSTVGKTLAQLLNFRFVDTDELIVVKKGISIPEIFKQFGENGFRQMETDVTRELSQQEGLVVATGGRLMLDQVNVDLLTKNGLAFCLDATAEEILSRLLLDTSNERPLLTVPDPKTKILNLLEERKKGYSRFETISTSGKEPSAIADEIMRLIDRREKKK